MFDDYRDLLNVEEVCEILSIGKNAAYRLLASGKLHCFRYNRVWKVPKEGVIEYIRQQSSAGIRNAKLSSKDKI
ncbi:MAG: helix-turn-helix domain-containing protein [Anaeromusa sp.]|uniref:helix-turn-helix domain-containing protein n=1 Tax=Anaeromusa sp. TaxID=1872520 RepID=UPI002B20BF4D|nr:helix-turn-helix domain-containing protein [Anaeromusa sp.]MEA4833811.1 helix-turn-helix domain-containing protein [Anaeromusa sp.]